MLLRSIVSTLSFVTSVSCAASLLKEEHGQLLYNIMEILGLLNTKGAQHEPNFRLDMTKFVHKDLRPPCSREYRDRTAYIIDEVVEKNSKEGHLVLLSRDELCIRPNIPDLNPIRLHVSGRLFVLEAGLVRDLNNNLRAFVRHPSLLRFMEVFEDKRFADINLIPLGARVKANGTFSLTRIEQVLVALDEQKNTISSFEHLLYKDVGKERCSFPFNNVPLRADLMRGQLSADVATLRIQLVRLLQLLRQRGYFEYQEFQNEHIQKVLTLLDHGPRSNDSEAWRREVLSVPMLTTTGINVQFMNNFFQMEPQLSHRFSKASLTMGEDGRYDLDLKDCKIKSRDTIVFLSASPAQIPLSAMLTTDSDTPISYSLAAFIDLNGILSMFKVGERDVEVANFGPYPHKEAFTIERYNSEGIQTFFRGNGMAFYTAD